MPSVTIKFYVFISAQQTSPLCCPLPPHAPPTLSVPPAHLQQFLNISVLALALPVFGFGLSTKCSFACTLPGSQRGGSGRGANDEKQAVAAVGALDKIAQNGSPSSANVYVEETQARLGLTLEHSARPSPEKYATFFCLLALSASPHRAGREVVAIGEIIVRSET